MSRTSILVTQQVALASTMRAAQFHRTSTEDRKAFHQEVRGVQQVRMANTAHLGHHKFAKLTTERFPALVGAS